MAGFASRTRWFRSARCDLGSRDCRLRHDLLHRRQIPEVERRRLCRLASSRRDSGHWPSRTHPVQREDGGIAARGSAARTAAAHARCAAGPRRIVVRAHRRERGSRAANRARGVALSHTSEIPLIAEWTTLFAVQAGAAATLTGLVFVAFSINQSKIMTYPGLPGRALESILQLLEVF